MISLHQIPLLRFFIFLLAGVFIGIEKNINSQLFFVLQSGLLFLLLVSQFIIKKINEKKHYKYQWVSGLIIYTILFNTGLLLVSHKSLLTQNNHFSHYNFTNSYCILKLEEPLAERTNSYRAKATVESLKINDKFIKTKGSVLLYLEKDSALKQLNYGSKILVKSAFTEVKPPQNPHEFDYKKYLSYNNIHHQIYRKKGEWLYLESETKISLFKYAHSVRNFIQQRLSTYGIKGNNYAVVSALLIGMKDALDNDTMSAFASAGAMHVLCVSGLHVGIIYLVLNTLLSFLNRNKQRRIIKAILVILFIWFYAILTGLSPSVSRAACMFSIIIIGQNLNKNTCIYNSILFSAIVLISINPFIVKNLGFWLSYLAVLGIVYLYPKIFNIIKIKNKYLNKVWALACVSMSAQIATAPISLYFFNQFPNYFLISNLFVVPLATLIVYTGITLVIFSFIPFLSEIIAFILIFLLNFLRNIVLFIENLPWATSEVFISQSQMFLLYIVVFFFLWYLRSKRLGILKISFVSVIIFLSLDAAYKIKTLNQKFFIVYSINKGFGIDFIKGRKSIFLADKNTSKNISSINYHIKNNRTKNLIREIDIVNTTDLLNSELIYNDHLFFSKNTHIYFDDKRITLLSNDLSIKTYTQKLKADYLIIDKIKKKEIRLLNAFITDNIILNSDYKNYKENLINELENTYNIYNIKDKGAFCNSSMGKTN